MFRRRTVITFEKLERFRYLVPQAELRISWCDACARNVSWLTPDQFVALNGLSLRELFRRIESGAVHFIESTNGSLLICPESMNSTVEIDHE